MPFCKAITGTSQNEAKLDYSNLWNDMDMAMKFLETIKSPVTSFLTRVAQIFERVKYGYGKCKGHVDHLMQEFAKTGKTYTPAAVRKFAQGDEYKEKLGSSSGNKQLLRFLKLERHLAWQVAS